MTILFLLALGLMVFVMKLIVLLLPGEPVPAHPHFRSIVPVSSTIRRARPVTSAASVMGRALGWGGAVALGYWVYAHAVAGREMPEVLLGYLAAPVLWLMGEFLVATFSVVLLPTGRTHPPVHDNPWRMRGVADFWGRRWNLWFSDWFRYAIFSRLRSRPRLAIIVVFALSGLMHEWVLNVPLYFVTGRALFGSMMLYFLLQAGGVLVERRCLARHSPTRIAFAWLVVAGPVPLLVHEGLLRVLHLWPR